MHKIDYIRQNSVEFDSGMKKRGLEKIQAQNLITIDQNIRTKKHTIQKLREKRKNLAKEIGKIKAEDTKNDTSLLLKQGEELRTEITQLEEKLIILEEELKQQLSSIPNLPEEDVPFGKNENDNIEITKTGKIREFDFKPKQHFEICTTKNHHTAESNDMDFKAAANISGSRFVILKNELAQLERALANFMLDCHTQERSYSEISVPQLVTPHSMFGTGQLPKFREDVFAIENEKFFLIPTAEVPLVNMYRDTILQESDLPIRITSHTQCFRSEAGSAGRDTRGMIRLHQFSKVELVHLCHPKQIKEEFDHILYSAETILQKLELPYRVVLLCSQDMGFAAQKTYDIEVWMPGQNRYREISSCSNCGDFQAVRAKIRYKNSNTGKNEFIYTLNGSGLAVGRTLAAILENNQQKDGSITIPKLLRKYMNNKKHIFI